MSDTLVAQAAQIERLTAEIVGIAEQTSQIVVMSAVRIGGLLKQAKALVAPGEWGDYLDTQCRFSHRTANNFMRLHGEWETNPNSQALANFGYTKAIRLLSVPEDERNELLSENDVQSMSTRELDVLIRERDAAKAEKQAAENAQAVLREEAKAAANRAAKAEKAEKDLRDQLSSLKAKKAEVPKSVRESIQAAAAAEAQQAAEKEFASKVQEMQQNLDAATAARIAAENAAAQAAAKLEDFAKKQKMSEPEIAEFNFLFNTVQEQINKMNGLRKKLALRDTTLADKLTTALRALAGAIERSVGDE